MCKLYSATDGWDLPCCFFVCRPYSATDGYDLPGCLYEGYIVLHVVRIYLVVSLFVGYCSW